eukprot:gb/GECH01009063.1/.p1 GENE.gb/GECH01009063.1/~~gb/GECH01009063.1/.p1  ORF type:complete len:218 (+),score=66.50 gb/GECH01009063.1/:1-654(+)
MTVLKKQFLSKKQCIKSTVNSLEDSKIMKTIEWMSELKALISDKKESIELAGEKGINFVSEVEQFINETESQVDANQELLNTKENIETLVEQMRQDISQDDNFEGSIQSVYEELPSRFQEMEDRFASLPCSKSSYEQVKKHLISLWKQLKNELSQRVTSPINSMGKAVKHLNPQNLKQFCNDFNELFEKYAKKRNEIGKEPAELIQDFNYFRVSLKK